MRLILTVIAGFMLAACGVDGEPVYPAAGNEVSQSNTGMSIITDGTPTQSQHSPSIGTGL